jgi:pimeloyl-ACP methyl ester carboxylesterase
MGGLQPQWLDVGESAARRRIAYLQLKPRRCDGPGLLWLNGFNSVMTGTKATALAEWAGREGRGCLRFDYSGHGQSEGRLVDGTIGRWLEEAGAVFCRLSRGPQLLVGSSMGGYIALLLLKELIADAPQQARRIAGLVLIAPAWNMSELLWKGLSPSARRQIGEEGVYLRPSRYGDGPYPITRGLIEDGRRHLIGTEPFDPGRPVHILHGGKDEDVPYEHTLDLLGHLSADVRVAAVADGDHRLSRPQDLALLLSIVGGLIDGAGRCPSPTMA